jgi:hypothetical protein
MEWATTAPPSVTMRKSSVAPSRTVVTRAPRFGESMASISSFAASPTSASTSRSRSSHRAPTAAAAVLSLVFVRVSA